MLAASKVNKSGSEKKKANENTSNKPFVIKYDISYVRCVTRKFQVVIVQKVK